MKNEEIYRKTKIRKKKYMENKKNRIKIYKKTEKNNEYNENVMIMDECELQCY